VKPPERYGFEKALAVIEEVYNENLQHLESSEKNEIIEICEMMKAMLFQHAVSAKPEEATKALKEEVRKAVKFDIWDPVFSMI
jgi:demethoxyubiquinone hydroxylase (CLK1/Coq7/Cat5 family)